MGKIFGEKPPVQAVRRESSTPFFAGNAMIQRSPSRFTPTDAGQAADAGLMVEMTAGTSCPIVDSGTLSEVSWGETSGLYPTENDKYQPDKWDAAKTCDLLSARRAIHEVAKRGQKTHKAKPKTSDAIEQTLKKYHFVENFPAADSEINDTNVKWFYLSNDQDKPAQHPSIADKANSIVKSYGPFYNNGGGDVGKGDTYIHFYKIDSTIPSKPPVTK